MDVFLEDVGDKLIEVVGVQSAIHAGSIYAGVRSSAKRLGQCSSVVIRYCLPSYGVLIADDVLVEL